MAAPGERDLAMNPASTRLSRRSAVRVTAALGAFLVLGLTVGAVGAQVPPLPPPPETDASTTLPPSPPSSAAPVSPPGADPGPPPAATPGAPAPAPAGPTTPAPPTTAAPARTSSEPTSGPQPGSFTSSSPRLDLSEIDALRRQARGRGPRPAEPDQGFQAALPFDPAGAPNGEASSGDPVELGVKERRVAQVRSAAALAAGLATLVLLGLVTWIRRQALV